MIYLAADHRGFELKEKIKQWLTEWGYPYEDLGAFEYDKDDDYPDFMHQAAQKVSQDPENSEAIILGGSGQGEAMVANRYKGVRAAVYYGPSTASGQEAEEIIKMTREHNNANVLSLGASFLREEQAKEALVAWFKTKFTGEERHVRRINKIDS